MAIEIPRIRQMEPEATPRTPGINYTPPNVIAPAERVERAAEGFAEKVIKYQNNIEDQTADTIATDQTNKFETWYNEQMHGTPPDPTTGRAATDGIKNMKGDPDKIYAEFDKAAQEKLNELSQSEGWSQQTQNLVNRRMSRKAEQLHTSMLTEYGNQSKKYGDEKSTAGVKLNQNGLVDATTFIRPDDATSFDQVNQRLNAITDLRIRQAVRNGLAQESENGEASYMRADGTIARVNLDPQVKYLIGQDKSKGLYDAIQNLVDVGANDKVNMMKEKYWDQLYPDQRDKLNKGMKTNMVKAEAFSIVEKAREIGIEAALKQASSEEVRHQALQFHADDVRHKSAIKKEYNDQNYKVAMNRALELMESGQLTGGMTQLEGDPVYKKAMHGVDDPKLKIAIRDQVMHPKYSDDKAMLKMQDLLTGKDPENKIENMSAAQFATYQSGLAGSEQRKNWDIYRKIHSPTGAQVLQSFRYADKELMDQLIGIGHIEKNMWGKVVGKDEAKLIKARGEMEAYLSTANYIMKPEEIKQHVREYVVSVTTGKALEPISKPNTFNGGGAGDDKKKEINYVGKMTLKARYEAVLDWRKANPGNDTVTPSTAVLNRFLNETSGKK